MYVDSYGDLVDDAGNVVATSTDIAQGNVPGESGYLGYSHASLDTPAATSGGGGGAADPGLRTLSQSQASGGGGLTLLGVVAGFGELYIDSYGDLVTASGDVLATKDQLGAAGFTAWSQIVPALQAGTHTWVPGRGVVAAGGAPGAGAGLTPKTAGGAAGGASGTTDPTPGFLEIYKNPTGVYDVALQQLGLSPGAFRGEDEYARYLASALGPMRDQYLLELAMKGEDPEISRSQAFAPQYVKRQYQAGGAGYDPGSSLGYLKGLTQRLSDPGFGGEGAAEQKVADILRGGDVSDVAGMFGNLFARGGGATAIQNVTVPMLQRLLSGALTRGELGQAQDRPRNIMGLARRAMPGTFSKYGL